MQYATFNMNTFFSPKSSIRTSRSLAYLMNTLNMLGPALLLCALLLLAFSQFGQHLPEQRQTLLSGVALLVVASLVIRIAWGIGIRLIAAKARRQSEAPPEPSLNSSGGSSSPPPPGTGQSGSS
jgi:hypothetical protein